jgi:hypothetical protein
MRLDLALAVYWLMQSVPIIRAQIWADRMRHVLLKKALQLQFG